MHFFARTFAVGMAVMMALSLPSKADTPSPCPEPPASAIADVDTLIARSSRIALVTLDAWTGAKPDFDAYKRRAREKEDHREKTPQGLDRTTAQLPHYRLTVVEMLKGPSDVGSILQAGAAPAPKGAVARIAAGRKPWDESGDYRKRIDMDFDAHEDDRFWSDARTGRVRFGTGCSLQPQFLAGTRYLLFVGPPHVKAYEAVPADDDRWLAYVRERLRDGRAS
ncbi:hypothetical protein BXY39_1652 [Eilatimonas milleporae]|uniref:Uncharacterized protein n=2 Tax=Eilatimonas milleporae TaxID=911205 RepID=A0A3M0CJF3_9PROT|nr:hypothetical protein BXY39_1652 [Eilatimonas milleporae]